MTSDVMQVNWFLGMRQPYQDVADNSMLMMILNNADRRFSPDYTSSPLFDTVVPQRPVRIQSNDGTTVHTHWVGWIDAIKPAVNKYGERVVQILASGAVQFLKAAETHLTLQQNQRTDEVIAQLIQEVVFPPALGGATWILGRVNSSELGVSTCLASSAP